MMNCHGNLVPPNIQQGRKIDAQLLLRSLAPSSYIYIQLLHEPILDDILDVPAFELPEEIVSSHDSTKKQVMIQVKILPICIQLVMLVVKNLSSLRFC